METTKLQRWSIRTLWAAMAAAVLAGCSGGGADNATVTVQGDVPLTYVKRSTAFRMNPTNGSPGAPGGDLMIREKSSPSAPEYNLTAQFTMGVGDASDPEVSYDGKKIVFAMRCPTSNTSKIDDVPACTGRWNIWEYDMTGTSGYTSGKFRRLTSSTQDDDVDPAYLPGGRGFVFSSNRQSLMKAMVGDQTFYAVDEYERERVLNLHTMDANGGEITQISVNQSHDRNPVVREDGEIIFSRWEHVGQHNRFAIFRVKPDGTDMFVLYGALSPGNSFLHPREMDPKGKYKGFLASDLMALQRTQEGGSLMFIDAANYSEYNTPANKNVAAVGGQAEVTDKALNQDRGLSPFGRVTTPYPLWDGTDRVLLAYRPCEVTRNGVVIPCANLTAEELARLGDGTRLAADIEADPVQDNAPAAYSIYMFDPAKQTWLLVAAPPSGFMYTDPIPLQARAEPNVKEPTSVDADLKRQNLGLVEVRSVYDTDSLGRMGEGMLAAPDLPAGCSRGIAMTTPNDTLETRDRVADLLSIKDPGNAAYHCAPARFIRAIRAVPPRSGTTGMRQAIGETNFEPQQILGYAQVEPDGSFKMQVPADTPLALTVVDAKGRNIQTHLNWIQVRPGERRTCDGCHSPRRGASLNSGVVVNTLSANIKGAMSGAHQSGETMASVRTRLQTALLTPSPDMIYSDAWADTTQPGITARAPIEIRYVNNVDPVTRQPRPQDDLQTAVPTDGLINYPTHIAPLWERDRGANTCTNCHTDTRKLDLRSTVSGTGRMTSYEELMLGDPVLDANGLPVTTIRNGVPEIERGAALVDTMGNNALGHTRSSRLGEILWGELLKADEAARTAHPTPPIDHSGMLNAAEKRLVTEWMDLGGQYYNDLSNGGAGVRLSTLSETVFASTIQPILDAQCASCHVAVGTNGAPSTATSFRENRFVLTGSDTGDFNVTLTMINDVCGGASNALLARPSTAPHPAGAAAGAAVPLPAGSANYNAIASWIAAGCR